MWTRITSAPTATAVLLANDKHLLDLYTCVLLRMRHVISTVESTGDNASVPVSPPSRVTVINKLTAEIMYYPPFVCLSLFMSFSLSVCLLAASHETTDWIFRKITVQIYLCTRKI